MIRTRIFAAALCLLALIGAAAASAQIMGLYYQEVEKDGRVYVFNTPETYKRFQDTGDMGTAITLIGRAVGGKTLVAENETAADLYNFKHSLPAYERTTPKPPTVPFEVSWKDGKTTFKGKNFDMKLSNRVQIRFTSEDLDSNSATSKPERDSFRIRRAKTKFEGWVYTKDLTYDLQLNWADSANVMEDVTINYDFTAGKKAFMIKAGQFKVPFGRQELTSSGNQQFVDRAVVSNTFARGRDIGVQIWGTPNDAKLDWRVGLFNGNGRSTSRNDNDDLQLNARLQWAPFGDTKYSEGDFDSSDKPLFSIAAEYESNVREIAAAGTTPAHQNDQTIMGYDAVFKFKGFSIYAQLYERENDRSGTLSDFDDSGTILQAGYFFVPQTWEVALRLAEFDPNDDRDNDARTEEGIALSYYFNKHPHKLQMDYRQIEDEARANSDDAEIRIQYQLIF
jgi:phosphate-selective porin OprO and OprP